MKAKSSIRSLLQLPFSENEKTIWPDRIFTILLVLCPIFQHYIGLFQDLGTTVMIITFCYFAFLFLKKDTWHIGNVFPLILLSVYEILNHGTGIFEVAREFLLIAYFIIAATGVIDLKYYSKIITRVAMIASVLLVIQYICYYVFGFHLQLVATQLLNNGAQQWVRLAQTGRISVTGSVMSLYRPSAFFLEPSHMTLFSFSALALIILSENFKREHLFSALLISLGCLLSTSGMGIALVLGIWGIYFIKCISGKGTVKERLKQLISKRNLVWLAVVLIAILLAYLYIPFFQTSINRIFGIGGTKSAIKGRMATGIKSLATLSGLEVLFGKQNWGNVHNWNMAGFFYTFYTQGFIGMFISFIFYVRSIFKTKDAYRWIALIVCGLSLITVHSHAAFYMFFYVMVLLGGYNLQYDPIKIKNFILPLFSRRKEKSIDTKK